MYGWPSTFNVAKNLMCEQLLLYLIWLAEPRVGRVHCEPSFSGVIIDNLKTPASKGERHIQDWEENRLRLENVEDFSEEGGERVRKDFVDLACVLRDNTAISFRVGEWKELEQVAIPVNYMSVKTIWKRRAKTRTCWRACHGWNS